MEESRFPSYLDEGPHGEQVGQHGGEPLGQAALGDEAQLQLRQTNGVVPLLPGPAGDVEQVSLRRRSERVCSCQSPRGQNPRNGGGGGGGGIGGAHLVVVLKHLGDNPDFGVVVLDGDHSGGGTKVM